MLTDDICDYFGVKIAMYFAWLGFYTTSMLYPAVIGFVLWMLTESDQVRRGALVALNCFCVITVISMPVFVYVVSDKPRHLLCGVCAVQRGVGDSLSGAMEEEGGRAGVQVGNTGHAV